MHNVVDITPTVGLAPTARYNHVYIHLHVYPCLLKYHIFIIKNILALT